MLTWFDKNIIIYYYYINTIHYYRDIFYLIFNYY